MHHNPSAWEAIWTLVTSPFMLFIFSMIIAAIIVVGIIDRSNRS